MSKGDLYLWPKTDSGCKRSRNPRAWFLCKSSNTHGTECRGMVLWLYCKFSARDTGWGVLRMDAVTDEMTLPEAPLKSSRVKQEPCFVTHRSRLVIISCLLGYWRAKPDWYRGDSDALHPFFRYELAEPVWCTCLDLARFVFLRSHVGGWLSNSRV